MKKRFLPMMTLILSIMLIITGMSTQITHAASKKHFLANTPFPPAIRVAIRENNPWGHPDPRGRIMYVKTYRTVDYMRNVCRSSGYPRGMPTRCKRARSRSRCSLGITT